MRAPEAQPVADRVRERCLGRRRDSRLTARRQSSQPNNQTDQHEWMDRAVARWVLGKISCCTKCCRPSSRGFRWFTEGFDTQDLKEAKALLDELGRLSQRKLGGSHSAGRARRRP